MGDSFSTNGIIIIQPESEAVPYSFLFEAATTATSNDGSIPFGSIISSAVVKSFNAQGEDKTSEMIDGTPGVIDNSVNVSLKYPSSGDGNYSLEFVLTLAPTAKLEYDFTRIFVFLIRLS